MANSHVASADEAVSAKNGHSRTPPPACRHPRDGLICWHCNDRPCQACGEGTGSGFLVKCAFCSYRAVGPAKEKETTTTTVVNKRREPYDVDIGRPGKWGNPYPVPRYSRQAAIARYEVYLMRRPDLLAAIVPELRGKRLGCYCAPLACHGQVLARLADATNDAKETT